MEKYIAFNALTRAAEYDITFYNDHVIKTPEEASDWFSKAAELYNKEAT